MKLFGVLLVAFLSMQASACIWVEGTSMDGHESHIGGYESPSVILAKSISQSPEERLIQLTFDRRWQSDGGKDVPEGFFDGELDGVEMIARGQYSGSVARFHKLEAEYPGRYSTAANLGTAYELTSDLENALKWISEGIRRNPGSHEGTEWLHREILLAKIRMKGDPNSLHRNHILPLPANLSKQSRVDIGGESYSIDQIRTALIYQLSERMLFVKAPDPVVADLLFTFGWLECQTQIVESGIGLLKMAKDYGYPDTAAIATKIADSESAIRFRKLRRIGEIAVWLAGLTGIVVGIVLFMRKLGSGQASGA